MLNYFKSCTTFEKYWLLISIILITIASIIWKSPWFGWVASISGIICVVLVAQGRISNYYFGIVNCIFYAYVAYGWQLYGETMLNLIYYLPMQFVGIYLWRKHINRKSKKIKVKNMSYLTTGVCFLSCLIWIGVYKDFLVYLNGNLTLIDSTSTVLSIMAMVLMAGMYWEQWILWIIVDVVSIMMWFIVVFDQGSNDIGVLIMWIAFLGNAIYGLINWAKLYLRQNSK